MSAPFPKAADEAINIVVDNGFATLEQAVKAVHKRVATDEIAEHLSRRDWIQCIREFAGTFWSGIEKSTKPSRGAVWNALYSTGMPATARPGVFLHKPQGWSESWRHDAMMPARAMLKAEKRCKAVNVDKAANWLSRNPDYWRGGAGGAWRTCSIESAFDWYVLLIIVLQQRMGVDVVGFETDRRIIKRNRGAR